MAARRRRRFARRAAILVIVLAGTAVVSTGASGRRSVSITRAEAAARDAVRVHSSYRQITSTRSGLVTRRCWRVADAGVRCSLYVVAPNPCALSDDSAAVCVQALWERRWLVVPSRHQLVGGVLAVTRSYCDEGLVRGLRPDQRSAWGDPAEPAVAEALVEGFYLDVHPVTNDDYDAFVADVSLAGHSEDPSLHARDRLLG